MYFLYPLKSIAVIERVWFNFLCWSLTAFKLHLSLLSLYYLCKLRKLTYTGKKFKPCILPAQVLELFLNANPLATIWAQPMLSLNQAQTWLYMPCPPQEFLHRLSLWRNTTHYYLTTHGSAFRVLPWHMIFVDKILMTSNFLQEHRYGYYTDDLSLTAGFTPDPRNDLSPAGVLTWWHQR